MSRGLQGQLLVPSHCITGCFARQLGLEGQRWYGGSFFFTTLESLKLVLLFFAPHGPRRGAALKSATRRGSARIWTAGPVIPAHPAALSLPPGTAARAGA
jgi:hypothetical protein